MVELGDGEAGEEGSWRGNSTGGGYGERNVEGMQGDGDGDGGSVEREGEVLERGIVAAQRT